MTASTTQSSTKGVSLSRGPALILGATLLVGGLFFLYKAHTFPRFSQFPSGTAHVETKAFFHIFGINGWSGELTAAAGGLLLIGAAQHVLAKTASLVVAVALGGVAVWALVNHHSALGLFAANIWTIVGWGGAAALLFVNTLLPRRRGSTTTTSTTTTEPIPARVTPLPAAPGSTPPPTAVTSAHEPVTQVSGPVTPVRPVTPVTEPVTQVTGPPTEVDGEAPTVSQAAPAGVGQRYSALDDEA